MRILSFFAILVTLITSPLASIDANYPTQTARQKKMMDEVQTIHRTFSLLYAPAELKKEQYGWEMQPLVDQLISFIQSNPHISNREFQSELRKLIKSSNDHHVHVSFYSNACAILPIFLQNAEEQYFLVDAEALFDKTGERGGDVKTYELLAIDEIPVKEYLEGFIANELAMEVTPTTNQRALMFFPFRPGSLGLSMPSDGETISFTVKSLDDPAAPVETIQKAWTALPDSYLPRKMDSKNRSDRWKVIKERSQMLLPEAEAVTQSYQTLSTQLPKQMKHWIEASKHFQPTLFSSIHPSLNKQKGARGGDEGASDFGRILWRTGPEWEFDGYVCVTATGRKIAYIKLPTYLPEDTEHCAEHFALLMAFFNKTSEALIIDQRDNSGGSLFYLYALASTLTDRPLRNFKEEEMLTYERIEGIQQLVQDLDGLAQQAEELGISFDELIQDNEEEVTIDGFPITSSFHRSLINYLDFQRGEWAEGKDKAKPYLILGIEYIQPHATSRYTKPILMLINENDASCADVMPALLQDNKRATLFGAKTAGAGGYVKRAAHQTWFGVSGFTYTGSVLWRLNNQPIESVGVSPDIPYAVTKKDLHEGFQDYQKAVLDALEIILK